MSTRIRDFATTAPFPAADDYVALDGTTNGTRRCLTSNLDKAAWLTRQVADFTAEANRHYALAADNIDVTLPASPIDGTFVGIHSFGTRAGCTLLRNGETIETLAEDLTIDSSRFAFLVVYSATEDTWFITE